jgi:hypothetical protein
VITPAALDAAWRKGFDAGFDVMGEHISCPYIVSSLSMAWDHGYARGREHRQYADQCVGEIERDTAGLPAKLYPAVGMRQALEQAKAVRAAGPQATADSEHKLERNTDG